VRLPDEPDWTGERLRNILKIEAALFEPHFYKPDSFMSKVRGASVAALAQIAYNAADGQIWFVKINP